MCDAFLANSIVKAEIFESMRQHPQTERLELILNEFNQRDELPDPQSATVLTVLPQTPKHVVAHLVQLHGDANTVISKLMDEPELVARVESELALVRMNTQKKIRTKPKPDQKPDRELKNVSIQLAMSQQREQDKKLLEIKERLVRRRMDELAAKKEPYQTDSDSDTELRISSSEIIDQMLAEELDAEPEQPSPQSGTHVEIEITDQTEAVRAQSDGKKNKRDRVAQKPRQKHHKTNK